MEVLGKKRLWDDVLLCSWPALASWMERQEQRWWAFWLFLRVDNGGREPLQVMGSLEGRDIVPLSGGCCSRSLPSRISPKAGIRGGHWSGWCCDSFLCPVLPSSQPHPPTHSFSFAGPEQRAAYFSLLLFVSSFIVFSLHFSESEWLSPHSWTLVWHLCIELSPVAFIIPTGNRLCYHTPEKPASPKTLQRTNYCKLQKLNVSSLSGGKWVYATCCWFTMSWGSVTLVICNSKLHASFLCLCSPSSLISYRHPPCREKSWFITLNPASPLL